MNYSVCSLQMSGGGLENLFIEALNDCCQTPRVSFQCWEYCAVNETSFSTWRSCVQNIANNTGWGTACQAADQSPLLTAIPPYPTQEEGPEGPPPPYYIPPYSKKARNAAAATTSSATSPSVSSNGSPTTSIPIASASSTGAIKSGSARVVELSISGLLCAFLVLLTLAL